MAAKTKKYLKLLYGLEKSGNPPVSDGTAKRSRSCFNRFLFRIMLLSFSLAPSDCALKYSSPPCQIISSSSCFSLKGDISSGWKNFNQRTNISSFTIFKAFQVKFIYSGENPSSSSRPRAGITFISIFELFKSLVIFKFSPKFFIFSLNLIVT